MQANWLSPLLKALDEAPASVEFFLRDDDAGWDDDRLLEMLEVVGGHGLPIDLAVIPRAVGADLAPQLSSLHDQWDGRLGLHQHGLAHHNHEPDGRKCEFGPSRGSDAQRSDLQEGRDLLESLLPGITQPVFTPPWNRCQPVTAELLADLGFHVLSRHAGDDLVSVPGLIELPVSDAVRKAPGERQRPAQLPEADQLIGVEDEPVAPGVVTVALRGRSPVTSVASLSRSHVRLGADPFHFSRRRNILRMLTKKFGPVSRLTQLG